MCIKSEVRGNAGNVEKNLEGFLALAVLFKRPQADIKSAHMNIISYFVFRFKFMRISPLACR